MNMDTEARCQALPDPAAAAAVIADPVGIATVRLAAELIAARLKATTGMALTRNVPTIRVLAHSHMIEPRPKTWAAMADALESLEHEVTNGTAAAIDAGNGTVQLWTRNGYARECRRQLIAHGYESAREMSDSGAIEFAESLSTPQEA